MARATKPGKSRTDWKIVLLPSSALHVRALHQRRARAAAGARTDSRRWRRRRGVSAATSTFTSGVHPQHGISYFVSGGAGSLRKADIRRPSTLMARGFDTDFHFMMMEISGDTLYFQAISRTGETIDAGAITRTRPQPSGPAAER